VVLLPPRGTPGNRAADLRQRRLHDALVQHGGVEPMTKEQCDFHIESVVGDWSATALITTTERSSR
jgi:hypothetical protein